MVTVEEFAECLELLEKLSVEGLEQLKQHIDKIITKKLQGKQLVPVTLFYYSYTTGGGNRTQMLCFAYVNGKWTASWELENVETERFFSHRRGRGDYHRAKLPEGTIVKLLKRESKRPPVTAYYVVSADAEEIKLGYDGQKLEGVRKIEEFREFRQNGNYYVELSLPSGKVTIPAR